MGRIEKLSNNVTLHLGDCSDMAFLLANAFVATDPPYNIGFRYSDHQDVMDPAAYVEMIGVMRNLPCAVLQYPEETMRYIVPALGVPDDCVAWCYNSNLPRQFRLWSVYQRRPNYAAVRQPAKNNIAKVVSQSVRSYDWISDIQQVKGNSAEKTAHPCQAPVALFERVIALCAADGEAVADPFMGSGTSGVAAVRSGRPFIGIEKDPAYFDIACERIANELARVDLFVGANKEHSLA